MASYYTTEKKNVDFRIAYQYALVMLDHSDMTSLLKDAWLFLRGNKLIARYDTRQLNSEEGNWMRSTEIVVLGQFSSLDELIRRFAEIEEGKYFEKNALGTWDRYWSAIFVNARKKWWIERLVGL